jgi:hypothetical protein
MSPARQAQRGHPSPRNVAFFVTRPRPTCLANESRCKCHLPCGLDHFRDGSSLEVVRQVEIGRSRYSDAVPDPQPFERALQVLAGTPVVLTSLVTSVQANHASDRRVSADAWSPHQILAHLLDVERDINPPRLHRLAEVDGLPIEPTGKAQMPRLELDRLLREWTQERAGNLAWLGTLTPDQHAHVSLHPRHGRISLEQHVVEWAYHDLDHLRQLLEVLGADLYPHMGSWQTLYKPPGRGDPRGG